MTTAAPLSAAAPAVAPTTTATGTPAAGGRPDGSAGPFTSLLAAALGEGVPPGVAEALGDLAEQADADEGAGKELSQEAVAEAVAAVAGAVQSLRVPLAELAMRAVGGSSDGEVEIPRWDSELAPLGEGVVAAGEASAEEDASTVPAATPTPTTPASGGTPATSAVTTAPATPVTPATPTAPAAVADPAAAAAATAPSVSAAAPAADASRTHADADAGAATEVSPAPATPSTSATSATAASAAPSGTAATEDAGLHARIVARVVQAVEALENAPPPRRMTVEIPDSDGLRLQVAMRGAEVHVSVQAGTGQPDLGAWGRELAASLASRGMTLGGFQTGTDGHPRRQPGQPHPDPDQPTRDAGTGASRTTPRPARDGDLRL